MSDRAIRFSFFEISWVIIAFLLIAMYFLLDEIRRTPPYIVLSEAEATFRFDSGSFELSVEFQTALADRIVPQIAELARTYKCDVVQVIGHTDGIGLRSKTSTLDYTVMPYLHDQPREAPTVPGSNVDLGMLRAIAVARFLQERVAAMPDVKHILPYSAGPIIDPRGRIRADLGAFEDRDSRRVELRLTVAGEQRP